MGLAALEGFTVGVTADRRAAEQSELLALRGANVVRGASIGTSYLDEEATLRRATRDLIASPPDVLVANTGIGMRSWFEAAQVWGLEEGLREALRGARILARGPKAFGAARLAGLAVDGHVASERLSEIRDMLLADGVAGCRIAVQLHGDAGTFLEEELTSAGAAVCVVPVYRWRLPDDPLPAQRLIDHVIGGRIDALTFTSAPAIRNLFVLAGGDGRARALLDACNTRVVVACVGPVCAQAAKEVGVAAPVWPEVGRMGNLVRALAEAMQGRRTALRLCGRDVIVQGSAVSIDEVPMLLSPRERGLFDALLGCPGKVVSKAQLEEWVWGEQSRGAHRLHVTVGRLRKRLGEAGDAIEPVYGRGYRLNAG